MPPVRLRLFLAILLLLSLPATMLAAAASLTIESVGGQSVKGGKVGGPLSGHVEVRGRATLDDAGGGAGADPATPLVAGQRSPVESPPAPYARPVRTGSGRV